MEKYIRKEEIPFSGRSRTEYEIMNNEERKILIIKLIDRYYYKISKSSSVYSAIDNINRCNFTLVVILNAMFKDYENNKELVEYSNIIFSNDYNHYYNVFCNLLKFNKTKIKSLEDLNKILLYDFSDYIKTKYEKYLRKEISWIGKLNSERRIILLNEIDRGIYLKNLMLLISNEISECSNISDAIKILDEESYYIVRTVELMSNTGVVSIKTKDDLKNYVNELDYLTNKITIINILDNWKDGHTTISTLEELNDLFEYDFSDYIK